MLNMKHNRCAAIHSGANLNKINRNRKMENMEKKLHAVNDT